MTNKILAYLEREHARLDEAVAEACRRRVPDPTQIARMKKLKLALKDQIASWHRELAPSELG
jgi:hypothetical protein